MGDSIVELELPPDTSRSSSSSSSSSESNIIKLPIVYRDGNNSESVFETMSIASIVEHDGILYRLRMPNAKDKINKGIKVTISGASEQESADKFVHELDHILNYRRIELVENSTRAISESKDETKTNVIPENYLDPTYFTQKKKSENAYNMLVDKEKGFDNITLDCFSIELGGSSHYLTYVAGQWFISFTNFFKFFSEDYRRRNINEIKTEIKSMSNKKTFCVKRDKVDDLLLSVYPIWSGYDDNRRELIGNTKIYYTIQDIKTIITNHMIGVTYDDGSQISPYPELQYGRGVGSLFEKTKKDIFKSVDKNFWKYVSIHPVWNTKEQFDSFFRDLKLEPDYSQLQMVSNKPLTLLLSSSDESDESDESDDEGVTYAFSDITYEQMRTLVGDTAAVEKHIKSYAYDLLEKLQIIDIDQDEIVNSFFGDTVDINKDLSVESFQEAMQTQANIKPGKFDLFVTLAKSAGVKPSGEDQKVELQKLETELEEAKYEIKSLALRKGYLVEFIQKEEQGKIDTDPGADENDQGKAADIQYQKNKDKPKIIQTIGELTKETASLELADINDKLSKLMKEDKVNLIKRKIHAMKNEEWFTLKHVFERVGVKETNKAASKYNAVYTLEEFDKMLTRFSGSADDTKLKQEEQRLKEKIQSLQSSLSIVDENAIREKIKELEGVIDETHMNFGVPDTELPLDTIPKDPKKLNSKRFFRGRKGEKLDKTIQYWMNKYAKGWTFNWMSNEPNLYGLTDHSFKKICLGIALSRENTVERTTLCLLHELGHVQTGFRSPSANKSQWVEDTWANEASRINHDDKWLKNAKKLFNEYFKENDIEPYQEPKQYHSHKAWHKVIQVERYKYDRRFRYLNNVITRVFYKDHKHLRKDLPDGLEIVDYDPKEYSDIHYSRVDGEHLRQKQRDHEISITTEILKLKEILEKHRLPETDEIKKLKEQLSELQAQRDYNARADSDLRKLQKDQEKAITAEIFRLQEILDNNESGETDEIKKLEQQLKKLIEEKNIYIFVDIAKYIRKHVRGVDDINGMVSDICDLYSSKSGEVKFKNEMKKILFGENKMKEIEKSDWVGSSGDIRSVHNYMEALVSVNYVSDESDEDFLKARTNDRFNGIPIALRYAMFLDGVPLSLLPKATFEYMSKFGKTVKKKAITENVLFNNGTRQKGLYDPVLVGKDKQKWSPPKNKEDYEAFHKESKKILNTDLTTEIPLRRQRRKDKNKKNPKGKQKRNPKVTDMSKTDNEDTIEIFKQLPDFFTRTKAYIEANLNTQPTRIERQSAAECGVHAVNNLLGSDYTLEEFQRVQGTEQWFTGGTLEIFLGAVGKFNKTEKRWKMQRLQLCQQYGINIFKQFPDHFMDDENLVGLLFFLGPLNAGHWTSMKKWGPSSFTYMDSIKRATNGDGGLVLTLPKDEMIDYIVNTAKYGRSNIKTILAVYKNEDTWNAADATIQRMQREAQTEAKGDGDNEQDDQLGGRNNPIPDDQEDALGDQEDALGDQEDALGDQEDELDESDDEEDESDDELDESDDPFDTITDKDALIDYVIELGIDKRGRENIWEHLKSVIEKELVRSYKADGLSVSLRVMVQQFSDLLTLPYKKQAIKTLLKL